MPSRINSSSAPLSRVASLKPRGVEGVLLARHGKQGSPWQISISALPRLAEAPPSAPVMLSAVIAGLPARSFLVRLLGRLQLNCGELVDPGTQVIGEQKRAATTLDRPQLARLDRFIEGRPAGARDGASLGAGGCQ